MSTFNNLQLRECITASDKTVREIATLAGVTEDCIFKLMRGRSRMPRLETVARLARALDVPMERFLTLTQENA